MMSVCHSTGRKETINVSILSVYCMCVRVIRAEAHALVELGNYKLRSRPWIVVDWPVSVQFGARAKHKNQSRGLLLTRLWLYVYTYNNNTGLGWAVRLRVCTCDLWAPQWQCPACTRPRRRAPPVRIPGRVPSQRPRPIPPPSLLQFRASMLAVAASRLPHIHHVRQPTKVRGAAP